MELKGSKTEQNLMAAFAGESQARNKYTYYAQMAREEGMEQIADIFEETARNEQEHAKLWFKALQVAKIEKHHEERYLKLLENVKNGKVFEKDEATVWVCDICGYRHEGTAAPKACPVCGYSGAHFAEEAKNY